MPVLNHTHTLRKVRKQKSTTFQCNDPKCSWKSPALLIEGKEFKCNYCPNVLIYNPSMVRVRFPHCKDCTNPKQGQNLRKPAKKQSVVDQDQLLKELLGGIE